MRVPLAHATLDHSATSPPRTSIGHVSGNCCYRLATNHFLGRGGDGYDMFKGGPRLIDAAAGKLMAAQVIEAIAAAGEIAPRVEGRIVRLD